MIIKFNKNNKKQTNTKHESICHFLEEEKEGIIAVLEELSSIFSYKKQKLFMNPLKKISSKTSNKACPKALTPFAVELGTFLPA